VREEDLLDLLRVHVEAARDDHVLLAVDDVEVPVVVASGQVACAQPAVADGGRGLLGLVDVAERHVRAADDDLADFAVGERARSSPAIRTSEIVTARPQELRISGRWQQARDRACSAP
jgi:hypothetical protein